MKKIIISPARRAFSAHEETAVSEVVRFYRENGLDFPYLGFFQVRFENELVRFMGVQGFARAVSSGTAACFIAFQLAQIKKNKKRLRLLLSPVADAGLVSALIILGIDFSIVDSDPGNYRVSLDALKAQISRQKVDALFLVHAGGYPNSHIDEISKECKRKKVFLIEDVSQCPGAVVSGKRVGTFGDVAVCSAMYRKSLFMGSQGGFIFTRKSRLMKTIISLADRGKRPSGPVLSRTPGSNVLVGLNWNAGEMACAIGSASLRRLSDTNLRRVELANYFAEKLLAAASGIAVQKFEANDAPFFLIVNCESAKEKKRFVDRLAKSGIPHNPSYDFLVHRWRWLLKHRNWDGRVPVVAGQTQRSSVNIYIHEGYSEGYIDSMIAQFSP